MLLNVHVEKPTENAKASLLPEGIGPTQDILKLWGPCSHFGNLPAMSNLDILNPMLDTRFEALV